MNKYKFSIIVPVYNAEAFLEECIESVINQSIGFKENVQLILVNDGSKDNSGKMCEKYFQRFPENIIYIDKENGGVASARNIGMEKIEGEYTAFLDSDDYYSQTMLENVYRFFKQKEDVFDVCVCRMEHVGDFYGKEHALNWRFENGNQVIDLEVNPEYVQSAIGNSVFRSEAIRDVRFDGSLQTAEDALFNTFVILKRMKLGICADATYFYRRFETGDSLTGTIRMQKEFYLDIPKNYYLQLIEHSKNKYGCVPAYVQHLLRYDIQWRKYIPEAIRKLNEEERNAYIQVMKQTLKYIDDEILSTRDGLNQYRRLYLFLLKHGFQIADEMTLQNGVLYYKDLRLINLTAPSVLKVTAIELDGNTACIEGLVKDCLPHAQKKIFMSSNQGERIPIHLEYGKAGFVAGYVGEHVAEIGSFKVEIPIFPCIKWQFTLEFNQDAITLNPSFDESVGLSRKQKESYFISGKYIVKYRKKKICFYKNTFKTRLASGFRYRKELRSQFAKGRK